MNIDMNLFHRLFRAHPWHGIHIGDEAPEVVQSYIEIVPADTVKYVVTAKTSQRRGDRKLGQRNREFGYGISQ